MSYFVCRFESLILCFFSTRSFFLSFSFSYFPLLLFFMFQSLQTRLKKASRWLPVALLPFAVQAQTLNYAPTGATNVAGTFADISTTGTAITTTSTDNANSAAQPIGFTFNFNG